MNKPQDFTLLSIPQVDAKIIAAFNQVPAGCIGDTLQRTLLDAAWAYLQTYAAKKRWLTVGDVADVIDEFAADAVMKGVVPKLEAGAYKDGLHVVKSLMASLQFRVKELQRYTRKQYAQTPLMVETENEDGYKDEIENPMVQSEVVGKPKIYMSDGLDSVGMPADERAKAEEHAAINEKNARWQNTKLVKHQARERKREMTYKAYQAILPRLKSPKHKKLISAIYLGESVKGAAALAGLHYGTARNLISKWQREALEEETTHAEYMAALGDRRSGMWRFDAVVGDYPDPEAVAAFEESSPAKTLSRIVSTIVVYNPRPLDPLHASARAALVAKATMKAKAA